MWLIICSGYRHTCFILGNLSFRINTTFIEIFYSFIIKNCFWKAHTIRNAICRKIEISEIYEIYTENSFHFRVFVKNLSNTLHCNTAGTFHCNITKSGHLSTLLESCNNGFSNISQLCNIAIFQWKSFCNLSVLYRRLLYLCKTICIPK